MNEDYNGPIYVDEDGIVYTLSAMESLVKYQAKNDPSVAEDLKGESPEKYWDDIISWGNNTGAAVGFQKYDNMEDYVKTMATKVIKAVTNANEVYVEMTDDDTFMTAFIAEPENLDELKDNINDEANKIAIFNISNGDDGIYIDDRVMTSNGDVKYIVNFEIDSYRVNTDYDEDIEEYSENVNQYKSQFKESHSWDNDPAIEEIRDIVCNATTCESVEVEKVENNEYRADFVLTYYDDDEAWDNVNDLCAKSKHIDLADWIVDDNGVNVTAVFCTR